MSNDYVFANELPVQEGLSSDARGLVLDASGSVLVLGPTEGTRLARIEALEARMSAVESELQAIEDSKEDEG